ncbi:MAG TPA: hypothetical protein VE987_13725 [Polyangiaceae bacterium]|nr:hypothetical protein [Polyangiaceae bacterium]
MLGKIWLDQLTLHARAAASPDPPSAGGPLLLPPLLLAPPPLLVLPPLLETPPLEPLLLAAPPLDELPPPDASPVSLGSGSFLPVSPPGGPKFVLSTDEQPTAATAAHASAADTADTQAAAKRRSVLARIPIALALCF